MNSLDKLLRIESILGPDGPIPMSRSSWWAAVKQGHAPQPVKIGKRMTAWKASEIASFIANPENWGISR